MSAPLPSPEEQAVIDRFEDADYADESFPLRVALAIHDAVCDCEDNGFGFTFRASEAEAAALAAIAVMRGEA